MGWMHHAEEVKTSRIANKRWQSCGVLLGFKFGMSSGTAFGAREMAMYKWCMQSR